MREAPHGGAQTEAGAETEREDPRIMMTDAEDMRTEETPETMMTEAGATRGKGAGAGVKKNTGPALVTMMTTTMTMIEIGVKRTGGGTIIKLCYMSQQIKLCHFLFDVYVLWFFRQMGSSSSTPLALDELTQPYIQSPRLTRELYTRHVKDEAVDEELLYHVPVDLLGKVSLHRSLDLSFNLIAEIPPGDTALSFISIAITRNVFRSSIESSSSDSPQLEPQQNNQDP